MVIDFNRPNGANAPLSGRSGSVSGGERAGKAEAQAAEVSNAAEKAPASGETVQLSPAAQQLQQASEKLRDTPEVDEARVARLRQAIADGSYQVDPQRLAAKMLAFETER